MVIFSLSIGSSSGCFFFGETEGSRLDCLYCPISALFKEYIMMMSNPSSLVTYFLQMKFVQSEWEKEKGLGRDSGKGRQKREERGRGGERGAERKRWRERNRKRTRGYWLIPTLWSEPSYVVHKYLFHLYEHYTASWIITSYHYRKDSRCWFNMGRGLLWKTKRLK